MVAIDASQEKILVVEREEKPRRRQTVVAMS
jgi:hypothetical protein